MPLLRSGNNSLGGIRALRLKNRVEWSGAKRTSAIRPQVPEF